MFKKSLFLLLLLSIFISGCTFLQKEEEDIPEPKQEELTSETRTGVIMANKQVAGEATHIIRDDQGAEALIVSLLVNLRKYEDRRVEVTGKLNGEIFVVEQVKKLDPNDDIKEIYQNTDLGFRLQYLKSWKIVEKEYEVIFTPYTVEEDEAADRVIIAQRANPDKKNPKEWLELNNDFTPKSGIDTNFYNEALVGLDQLIGIKQTSTDGAMLGFYVSRDDAIYGLIHETVNDEDKDTYRNAFLDIVHSFQFVARSEDGETVDTETVSTAADEEQKVARVVEDASVDAAPDAAYEPVQNYLNKSIKELVGVTDFDVEILRFEFVENKYVYVIWDSNDEHHKTLFEYSLSDDQVYTDKKAEFIPGESRDWQLADGDDVASGKAKTVITVSDGKAEAFSVQEGYQLLEARTFDIKMQYPRNWYWARFGTGYSFDSKPVEEGSNLLHFSHPSDLPEGVSDYDATHFRGEIADTITYCTKSKTSGYFCLSGTSGGVDEETMRYMLTSIVEPD